MVEKKYEVSLEIVGLALRSSNVKTLERSRGPAAMFTRPDTGAG